jgi:hypothetical protein
LKLRITIQPRVVDIKLSDEEYERYLDVKSRVASGECPEWYLDDMWDCEMSDIDAEKRWEVID